MEYATQMDAARKGIYTKELLAVAEDEKIDKDELIKLVAKGQVIIPANKNHKCLKPSGIGTKLRTKINVNLGTSRDWTDLDMEMEKVKSAVDMGAEAIMDLSSCGDTQAVSYTHLHIEGHIAANYIEHKDLEPPFLCLVVSGGHTHLVRVLEYGKFEIIGCTHDDLSLIHIFNYCNTHVTLSKFAEPERFDIFSAFEVIVCGRP